MKTVVLGAGALGSILAAHLAHAGHDVAVVAREPRASQLRRDGLRVRGLRELVAHVPVYTDPALIVDAQLVINALKTQQNADVLPRLTPGDGAVAFSVQNGVLKNDQLATVFGRSGVLGASAMVSGEVEADGGVRFTLNEMLLLGEPGGGLSERSTRIAGMLNESGIMASASDDIHGVEWSKYALFVPLFCLSLIARTPTWRFLSEPHGAAAFARLVREMARLAAAEGVTLRRDGATSAAVLADGSLDECVARVQAWGERLRATAPAHKVSSLQDLERGRPTEVEAIVAYAARRARDLDLDLPTLDSCSPLCAAISALSATR